MGASLLNLVDAVIREQGRLPPDQRRGALVVVDEMQAMPGVDYESMLSELGKFGASFILATQSLAKLADLSARCRTLCWPTWGAWRCSRWPPPTPGSSSGNWTGSG